MSQFSQGIRDFMGIAQLAEQLNAQDAAAAQRARYEQMAQAQFQQQQAELLHRRQMEDAGRAVWLNQIDRLGGFTDLGSQQGGVAGAGSPAPVPPVGPGQYGPLQQGQQFAPPPGPQGLPTTGPLTLEQQIQQSFQPQQSPASMLTGLSRQALAGASPQLVQQIAETMMAEQDRARQLRAKSDMEFQSWHRGELERQMRREAIRSDGRRAGLSEEDIQNTIALHGLSEAGVPAGVLGQLGERMWPEPQEYQPTAQDFMALGVPGGQATGEDSPAAALARMGASPSEAARFVPDGAAVGDPEAQIADFIRSVEGPTADPADPSTWTKLNPTGVEVMRLKMRRGEAITDQVLSAVLPESDNRTKIAFLKWQADQMAQRYRSILNASTYAGGPSKLDVANAEAAWVDAARAYGTATGVGVGQNQPTGPQQPTPAQPAPAMQAPNELDAMVPQVFENLRARLGRNPTRDEVEQVMRSLAGGG